jgi:molecular chaperone DnaK (HSP70)
VPKVQDLIKEATGKQELMVHLNGDESMSFGSSFIAANYSDQF